MDYLLNSTEESAESRTISDRSQLCVCMGCAGCTACLGCTSACRGCQGTMVVSIFDIIWIFP